MEAAKAGMMKCSHPPRPKEGRSPSVTEKNMMNMIASQKSGTACISTVIPTQPLS